MFLTGLLVLKNAVRVNYTRKINHFTSLVAPYLLSFMFKSGIASNIDTSIVTEAVQFLNNPNIQLTIPLLTILIKPLFELLAGLLYFVFLIKPSRERVRFFNTAFLSINRPEDEPNTLFWMVSQLVATYTVAAIITLYLGLIGKVELIFVSMLISGIGDGLAEPIGIRFGKHKYETTAFLTKKKYTRSFEGSAFVFLTSLITIVLFMSSFTWIQFIIALLAFPIVMTLTEAKAPHSWDNPFIFAVGGILFFLIFHF